MEKLKIYVTPSVEILACAAQALMKVGSETPEDPTDKSSAPASSGKVF